MVSVGGAAVKRSAAELVLETVAGSVDREDFAVMEEAVEDGGGDDVVAEELAPAIERYVAGDHQRTPRVAGRDQLKEQIGATSIHGQIAELIHDQKIDAAQMREHF